MYWLWLYLGAVTFWWDVTLVGKVWGVSRGRNIVERLNTGFYTSQTCSSAQDKCSDQVSMVCLLMRNGGRALWSELHTYHPTIFVLSHLGSSHLFSPDLASQYLTWHRKPTWLWLWGDRILQIYCKVEKIKNDHQIVTFSKSHSYLYVTGTLPKSRSHTARVKLLLSTELIVFGLSVEEVPPFWGQHILENHQVI